MLVLVFMKGRSRRYAVVDCAHCAHGPVPPMDNTVNVNAANLAAIKDNNLDEIKFATVLRGYRQDQVDVVIDALLTEIAQLRKQVAEINSTPQ